MSPRPNAVSKEIPVGDGDRHPEVNPAPDILKTADVILPADICAAGRALRSGRLERPDAIYEMSFGSERRQRS
jgi:hypothetical protein